MTNRSKGPGWSAVTLIPLAKPVITAEDFSRLIKGPRKFRPVRITRPTVIPTTLQ